MKRENYYYTQVTIRQCTGEPGIYIQSEVAQWKEQ